MSVVLLMAVSCGKKTSFPEITHMPFKTESDGKWGLVGTDGKILVEPTYEFEPSAVVNGVFSVPVKENKDDWYANRVEYYTASKTPKQIGETYEEGGYLNCGVIPVVKEDSPVLFIDKNGKEAFEFTEHNGKPVLQVANMFTDNLCAFYTEAGYGFVNNKGKVVIEPNKEWTSVNPFNEGLAIVVTEKGLTQSIDTKGNVVGKNLGEYGSGVYMDGLFVNDGVVYDRKGEKVFETDKGQLIVSSFVNGYAVFYKDGCFGVLNKKGEVVVKPKYSRPIGLDSKGVYFAEKDGTVYVSYKDKVITDFKKDVFPVSAKALVCRSDKGHRSFVKKDGKDLNKDLYKNISLDGLYIDGARVVVDKDWIYSNKNE